MQSAPTFDHPLLPAPSQDPWVTAHAGIYHALITDGQRIFLRRSTEPANLFRQPPTTVWRAPRRGPDSKHVWAPELHRFDDRWIIVYAADDGRSRNHRLWVLEAAGHDPAGPYRSRGMLETGGWSIDGTILSGPDERRFLVWSGWAGRAKGPQNLYLAPMKDALTLGGPRVLLARPDQPWEQRVSAILEGPAVWQRGGVTCIVYSASASWTVHSCLGMLVNRDGDYLNPDAWTKTGPVFARTPQTWGIGHCSLVDLGYHGTVFYHAKTRRTRGWRDRDIRAQNFRCGTDGIPAFGEPS